MKIILLVPNVVSRYIESFPETTNNAYKYFNYDHRVVDERVDRGDQSANFKATYKTPSNLTDMDYDSIVQAAKLKIDSNLARYSMSVACEDALHTVIGTLFNGQFDHKVNASKYNALLCALKTSLGIVPQDDINYRHASENVEAAKKEKAITKVLHPRILKELGLKNKDIPRHKKVQKGIPHFIRTDKGVEVRK